MTFTRLVIAGLRHDWRQHVGAVLATAVAAAVIVGALMIGDSVRESLRHIALMRIGQTSHAVITGDRFFTIDLAQAVGRQLGTPSAGVIITQAVASKPDGSARANQVQMLGVDETFWRLAPSPSNRLVNDGEVHLSRALARQLRAREGDTIVLRMPEPTALPRDAPLTGDDDAIIVARLTVTGVVDDHDFGRFSLRADQATPFNAYVPRQWLAQQLDVGDGANLMLLGNGPTSAETRRAIREHWRLTDGELNLTPDRQALRTRRVFLSDDVGETIKGDGVLTYLANSIEHADRSTPYSMVAGLSDGLVAQLGIESIDDDAIVINEWLAEDLDVNPGDVLTLRYYRIDSGNQLTEVARNLMVQAVVPIDGLAADRTLTPDFPGLAEAERYRDWDAGPEIDLTRIRDKDEAYWDEHRATPKAFVSLATARSMWTNRFGDLTEIRFDTPQAPEQLVAQLDPKAFGLSTTDLRGAAMRASEATLDFGQLFAALSLFVIVAAVILAALLQAFGVEQRARRLGTLLALGWRPGRVKRLLSLEAALVGVMGCVIGAFAGVLYTHAVLWALSSIWSGAVASAPILFHTRFTTFTGGLLGSCLVVIIALKWAMRRAAKHPVTVLLYGNLEARGGRPRWWTPMLLATAGVVGAIILATLVPSTTREAVAARFFGVGAMLLIALIAASRVLLSRGSTGESTTLLALAFSQAQRRGGRSVTVIGLLAAGVFLITAVSAFRLDANPDPRDASSGTGAFALIGESTLPIVHPLNTPDGRERAGLDHDDMADVAIMPIRVLSGDDASCLNLNRSQQPRLLGVNPAALDDRGAFSFASGEGWRMLDLRLEDNIIPAIADQNTALWALGMSLGDRLTYIDEQGRPFDIQLVGLLRNSILQGSLIIAEDRLVERFPSITGYRMMLIDAPPDRVQEVEETLSVMLGDTGLAVTPATRRLAAFNEVQNTYLSIFQALGGLGMALGGVGLAVVVLRNLLERRAELATLRAIGWTRKRLRQAVLLEHGMLLGLGLLIGTLVALVAVAPELMQQGPAGSLRPLLLTIFATAFSGALGVWLAALAALRVPMLTALRRE